MNMGIARRLRAVSPLSWSLLDCVVDHVAGQRPTPPRIEVKQTGPVPGGLPVWLKITSSVVLSGGLHHKDESVSEVTDLMEGTLSDKLFQPPEGYQRVANLPNIASSPVPPTWGEVFRIYWQRIENWFFTLF